MITYGFFNSVNGDRRYDADQISEFFKGLISNGVYENIGDGLVVSAGTGMNITVGTGRAAIECKWIDNDATETLAIAGSHSTYDRIDAVVVRLDRANRLMEFGVVTGIPAASPEKPALTRNDIVYELALAYVTVPAASTSVTDENIEDVRSISADCGWVTGLITQLDISTLYQQWIALFQNYFDQMAADYQEWFDTLSGQLNVNTFVQKFEKSVTIGTSGATNEVELDMTGYTYSEDDVINVYINGLLGRATVDYTATESEGVVTVTTEAEANGTDIDIVVYKSMIGWDILAGSDGDIVVSEDNESVLMF